MSLSADIERALSQRRTALDKRLGAREQIILAKEKEEATLAKHKEAARLAEQGHIFLLSEIVERRQQAIEAIESMGTSALRLIYGPDYALQFNTFEERRKDGHPDFRMEIQVASKVNDRVLVTGLQGERGGGVQEIVAFSLRMAALDWVGYDGPVILDEAYKSISSDRKLEAVAQFLRYLATHKKRQVIFATHKADVFGKYADNIVQVEKRHGIGFVREVEYEELLTLLESSRVEVEHHNPYTAVQVVEENA